MCAKTTGLGSYMLTDRDKEDMDIYGVAIKVTVGASQAASCIGVSQSERCFPRPAPHQTSPTIMAAGSERGDRCS